MRIARAYWSAARFGGQVRWSGTHLLRVYGKLGVSDRTSAVPAALDLGLVRRRT
ncbi:hypothetical protein [Nonomuraea candida]|uniref:hypothetical protein n=1 Tax=Nonomuraea candida TaxID=359159 RepID=UPI000A3E440C|nr:hypothetical protein [Nonomuraea candida]